MYLKNKYRAQFFKKTMQVKFIKKFYESFTLI